MRMRAVRTTGDQALIAQFEPGHEASLLPDVL